LLLWNREVQASLLSLLLITAAHAETYTCKFGVFQREIVSNHLPWEECKGVEIRVLNKDGSLNRIIQGRPLTPEKQAEQQKRREEHQKIVEELGKEHERCLKEPDHPNCLMKQKELETKQEEWIENEMKLEKEQAEWCKKYPDALGCGGANGGCLTYPGSLECKSDFGPLRQATSSPRDSGPSTTQPDATR